MQMLHKGIIIFRIHIAWLVSWFLFVRPNDLPLICPSDVRYRTFNGYCNNLKHPSWGQAGTAQKRFLDAEGNPMVEYDDGFGLPRGGIPSRLPSPRLVSNTFGKTVFGPTDQSDGKRSGQNMAFGQLIAHDIIKTRIPTGPDCCDKEDNDFNNTDVCFPFEIPSDDERFHPGCKSFVRAASVGSGVDLRLYRENINDISAFIDAGFLYGSSDSEVQALRVENSYLMKTETDNLLPLMNISGCVQYRNKCPIAGDSRVAVVPNLAINHLMFVREHNRIASFLNNQYSTDKMIYTRAENGSFDEEKRNETIFQETRRIIIAMLQHITYNHYLPTILDHNTMTKYNLYSKPTGYDDTYDNDIDPSIRNGFGTAPFRFGHSQIMADQSLLYEDYSTMNIVLLEDTFKNPILYTENNGSNVPHLARWLTFKPAQKIDVFMEDGVRDELFVHAQRQPDDLFALNLQRGRDQGTPGFNEWRRFCSFSNMSFEDFGNASEKLANLYKSPDDIDFFIGGLLETSSNGGMGPTFACIIAAQFQLFKTGDRFWYERSDPRFSFTEDQLNSIKHGASLSKMFCRNFGLTTIQKDVFKSGHDDSILVNCTDLPDIDLTLWKIPIDTSCSNIVRVSKDLLVVYIACVLYKALIYLHESSFDFV